MTSPTRILCLGNELAGDDGIGSRVGRILRTLELPPGITVELGGRIGLELLDTLQAGERLVFVDAMQSGRPPGACSVFEFGEQSPAAQSRVCCHEVGLEDVLALARRLAPERLPSRVVTIGVEAAVIDRFETRLSDAVREALPHAVEAVLRTIDASDALVAKGIAEATRLRGWDPAPLEAVSG